MEKLLTLISFIIIFNLCFFTGLALQKILNLKSQNLIYDIYWASPLIGVGVLMMISIIIGYFFGFNFFISFIPILAITAFSIYKNFLDFNFKKYFILNITVIAASIVTLGTMLKFGGFNPYNDAWTYISQAQWLQDNPFSKKTDMSGFYPMQSQITLYQNMGSRMGASYLLGYFQSILLFNWSYYPYLACVALATTSAFCVLVSYFKEKFGLSLNVILASSILLISQNGFINNANYGFFPQTFGLANLVGIIIFTLIIFEKLRSNIFPKRLIFILSILVSSLMYSYNDIAPPVFLAFTIFLISQTFSNRNYLIISLKALGVLLLFVSIIVNIEVLRIIDNFITGVKNVGTGDIQIGWPIYWNPIQFFAHSFGLKSTHNTDLFFIEYIISNYFFILILIATIFLIKKYKIYNSENFKTILKLFFSFNLIFLILWIKFRYFSNGFSLGETGNTFLQFKLYGWLSVINIPFLIYCYLSIFEKFEFKIRKFLLILLISSSLIGTYIHGFFWPNYITKQALDNSMGRDYPFRYFLELRELFSENINKEKDITYVSVGNERHKIRQMIAYVLYDYKLISDYRDDGYIAGNIKPSERNIHPSKASYLLNFDLTVPDLKKNNFVFQHGFLHLFKMPEGMITLEKIKGADNREVGGTNTWYWVEDKVKFYFKKINKASDQKWKLSFTSLSAGKERELYIRIYDEDNQKIFKKTIKGAKSWKDHQIEIKNLSNNFILEISSSGEKVQLSEHDKRKRKFLIQNLSIAD